VNGAGKLEKQMLSTELVEYINQSSELNAVPRIDFSTELIGRMKDGFVYFNASRYPHFKRVSITQANGEYQCVAQSHNGGNLNLSRQNFDQLADVGCEQLLASVEAVGGQCQLAQDILNIDVPAGYHVVLTLRDASCHKVHIAPVAD
jgi:hypothetical protein